MDGVLTFCGRIVLFKGCLNFDFVFDLMVAPPNFLAIIPTQFLLEIELSDSVQQAEAEQIFVTLDAEFCLTSGKNILGLFSVVLMSGYLSSSTVVTTS